MFMRYEWGLAVGHTYAHADSVSAMQSILGNRVRPEGIQHGSPSTGQSSGCPGTAVASLTSITSAGNAVNHVSEGSQFDNARMQSSSAGTENGIGGIIDQGDRAPQSGNDEALNDSDETREGGDGHGDEEDDDDEYEDEGSEDGSIDTDTTSVQGYIDEEDDRMMSLYGADL